MTKRNVDDLNMYDDMAANGDGDLGLDDLSADAKKAKLDPSGPSRVLHFRNVPSDASESEIIQLGLPFGKMTNMLLIRNKNQALLEMADTASAQAMVNYYSSRLPNLRGRPVYVQYSRHDQLKTNMTNQNTGAQAALQAAQQLLNNVGEGNCVLHITVEHMIYPVTIDIFKEIFQKFGQVLKIITFNKNGSFQALIQFSDPVATQAARVALNGQNIYDGCCTLRIDLSKLTNLNVKFNNDHSRDFTNPMLPSGESGPRPGAGLFGSGPGAGLAGRMPGDHHGGGMRGSGNGMNDYGGGQMGGGSMMQNMPSFGGGSSNYGAMSQQHGGGGGGGSPVILVSNLNEERATPDALFVLFGVYGDVQRVKILFKKKDNALIQFTDPNMARTAINNLDRVEVWGKRLKLAPSKHPSIQIPREGQEDTGLTKDFAGSPLHRFRNPNSKNFMNIFPPSATLHLFNIPSNASEEEIKDLFSAYGRVVNYRVFQKDRRMAQLEMGSIGEAIEALIAMHNYKLGDQNHLKVSFAKGNIS